MISHICWQRCTSDIWRCAIWNFWCRFRASFWVRELLKKVIINVASSPTVSASFSPRGLLINKGDMCWWTTQSSIYVPQLEEHIEGRNATKETFYPKKRWHMRLGGRGFGGKVFWYERAIHKWIRMKFSWRDQIKPMIGELEFFFSSSSVRLAEEP